MALFLFRPRILECKDIEHKKSPVLSVPAILLMQVCASGNKAGFPNKEAGRLPGGGKTPVLAYVIWMEMIMVITVFAEVSFA